MQLRQTLRAITDSLRAARILLRDYRHFESVRTGALKDADDNYIPWFTYPAIEALKSWDLSERTVLEYGSGYSTLFWAKQAKSVAAIEHDFDWYEKIRVLLPVNADLTLRSLDIYPEAHGKYDIIVIDGYAQSRMRYRCAVESLPHWNRSGLIILDNSDWLPATCLLLRRQGLTQIDFNGLVPGNAHAQTTSFFIGPEFNFQHAQRMEPVGGTGYNWEPQLEREVLAQGNGQISPSSQEPIVTWEPVGKF